MQMALIWVGEELGFGLLSVTYVQFSHRGHTYGREQPDECFAALLSVCDFNDKQRRSLSNPWLPNAQQTYYGVTHPIRGLHDSHGHLLRRMCDYTSRRVHAADK